MVCMAITTASGGSGGTYAVTSWPPSYSNVSVMSSPVMDIVDVSSSVAAAARSVGVKVAGRSPQIVWSAVDPQPTGPGGTVLANVFGLCMKRSRFGRRWNGAGPSSLIGRSSCRPILRSRGLSENVEKGVREKAAQGHWSSIPDQQSRSATVLANASEHHAQPDRDRERPNTDGWRLDRWRAMSCSLSEGTSDDWCKIGSGMPKNKGAAQVLPAFFSICVDPLRATVAAPLAIPPPDACPARF